jgi:hypothetical protein
MPFAGQGMREKHDPALLLQGVPDTQNHWLGFARTAPEAEVYNARLPSKKGRLP